MKGGIIGITKQPEALERWFLTSHQRAAITTAMKEMCNMEESEGPHKEASPFRILRDEEGVQKTAAQGFYRIDYQSFHI